MPVLSVLPCPSSPAGCPFSLIGLLLNSAQKYPRYLPNIVTVKVLLKSAVLFMVSGWFFLCQVFPSSEAKNVSD